MNTTEQEKTDQIRNVKAAISAIAISAEIMETDNRRAMNLLQERVNALQLHFNALEYDLQAGWDNDEV
jgi:uncharacterized protein YqeY